MFLPQKEWVVDEDGDVTVRIGAKMEGLRGLLFGSREQTLTLDELGSAVWILLAEGRSLGELLDALIRLFPEERALRERVEGFLEFLLQKELLRAVVRSRIADPPR